MLLLAAGVEADDWKWVLRSASSVRPVLAVGRTRILWAPLIVDSESVPARVGAGSLGIYGRRSPAWLRLPIFPPVQPPPLPTISNLANTSRLVLAGQMSYEGDSPAGGIATVWLPSGSLGAGPHTALVLRESKLGPVGPTFRGVRIDQGGAMVFGTRAVLRIRRRIRFGRSWTSSLFPASTHASWTRAFPTIGKLP